VTDSIAADVVPVLLALYRRAEKAERRESILAKGEHLEHEQAVELFIEALKDSEAKLRRRSFLVIEKLYHFRVGAARTATVRKALEQAVRDESDAGWKKRMKVLLSSFAK
jgi:hypothetical protein